MTDRIKFTHQNGTTASELIRVASEKFKLSESEIMSRSRTRPIPQIKQVIMWYLVNQERMSLNAAGQSMGYASHCIAIHAVRLVENRAHDPLIRHVFKSIMPEGTE
jgi:chromosomal replication initiation ATPase DnaA